MAAYDKAEESNPSAVSHPPWSLDAFLTHEKYVRTKVSEVLPYGEDCILVTLEGGGLESSLAPPPVPFPTGLCGQLFLPNAEEDVERLQSRMNLRAQTYPLPTSGSTIRLMDLFRYYVDLPKAYAFLDNTDHPSGDSFLSNIDSYRLHPRTFSVAALTTVTYLVRRRCHGHVSARLTVGQEVFHRYANFSRLSTPSWSPAGSGSGHHNHHKRILFVCGGSGLAPVLPLVEGRRKGAEGAGLWTVLHVVPRGRGWGTCLETLQEQWARSGVCLQRLEGRTMLLEALDRAEMQRSFDEVFVCGPPDMVHSMQQRYSCVISDVWRERQSEK